MLPRHKFPLLLLLASGATLAATQGSALLPKANGPGNGYASAPPAYDNCTWCHDSFSLGSGGGSVTINGLGGTYTPGNTYNMTVTVAQSTASRWGFELVALNGSGASVGTLTPVDGNTQVSTSGGITYLKQTSTGTFSGTGTSATWNFQFTAPGAGTGTVRFHASGLAANGNGNTSGDYVYAGAYSAGETPADATVVAQPALTAVRLGTNWTIPVYITDGTGAANTIYLVTRVRLSPGNYYPSTGWLLGPMAITLPAGGTVVQNLVNSIPPSAPLITATYEILLGRPPGTLVDMDTVTFTLFP